MTGGIFNEKFLKKAISGWVLFCMLASPLAPVFAQVADTGGATSSPTPDSSAPAPTDLSVPSPDSSSAASQSAVTDSSLGTTPAATPPLTVGRTRPGKDNAFSSSATLSKYSSDQIAQANRFDLSPSSLSSIAANKWLNSYESLSRFPRPTSISGAFTYDVPIATPPGRNGVEPDLKLSYNNQDKRTDSIFGYAWSINIPYIERVNLDGVNKLYNEWNFTSTLDGDFATSSAATTTGNYGARFDDGSMRQYHLSTSTNTWTMTDKNGTQYTFGSSTTARMYDSGNSSHVARWYLEKVQDTNGNTMSYTYTKDSGQVYPLSITYTSNGASSAPFEVDFTTNGKTYTTHPNQFGFEVDTAKKINEIDIKFNGNLINKYVLTYTLGFSQERDLLSSITQTGYDESNNPTTLPALTFGYQQQDTTWATSTPSTPPAAFADETTGADLGYRFFHWRANTQTDGIHQAPFFRSAYEAPGWTDLGSLSIPNLVDDSDQDIGSALVDINGDGMADIIQGKDGAYHDVYIWTSGGNYVSASTTMTNLPTLIDSSGNDTGTRFGDFNGDGYADYIVSTTTGAALYLNKADGTGWASSTPITGIPSFIDSSGNDTGARVMDVNGDGLDDIIKYQASDTTGHAYINEDGGTTWDDNVSLQGNVPILTGAGGANAGAYITDIDGDGLQDIVVSTPNRGTHFYINKGFGWIDRPISSIPFFLDSTDSKDIGTRIIDGNSDGIPDFVTANTSVKYNYLSSGHPVDQLISVGLPTGGNISVTYQGIRVNATYLSAVATVTTDPGLGQASTTKSYITPTGGTGFLDGQWQSIYQDRKFAGFGKVLEFDNNGNETVTYYHQGNGNNLSSEGYDSVALGEYNDTEGKMYQPYRVEQYTSNNFVSPSLQKVTINEINTKDLGNGRTLVYKANTVTLDYDGQSTHRDSAVAYDYATSTGNLIEQDNYGEVTGSNNGTFTDSGTDKVATLYTYASDASSTVTGKPSTVITNDNSGTKIAETQHVYDGLSLGDIGVGNETKTLQWRSGSSYASTTKAYNSFGMVATSTDADSHSTTFTYDTFNLYPATTTDALGHVMGNLYNYTTGKVKQTTDPNGVITRTTYDGLGRVTAVSIPDLSATTTLVTKTVYVYTDTAFPYSQRTDYLSSATSTNTYTYQDGLGRTMQVRKSSETAGTYAVTDTQYNYQGLVSAQSLPYFSSGSASTTATTSSPLFTYNQYDSLGRLGTTTNAVGTTTSVYDQWKTTVTDAKGVKKDLSDDAFGNLVEVDEHNGTSTYTTAYTYNGNGLLTKITDALSNIRNFTYDGMGRRTSAEDLHAPTDGTYGTWNYTYDDANNLTQTVDPKSQTINYTFDALNRPATEDYTGSSGTEVTYTYDNCALGVGKLCTASSTNALIKYAYNANGGVQVSTSTIVGTSTAFAMQYSYDRQGNQTYLIYPDGGTVGYLYNAAGLIDSVSRQESGSATTSVVANIDYSPTADPTVISYANGTQTTNTYDPNSLYRLQSKVSTLPSTNHVQDLTYTYDALGNITHIVDASNTATAKITDYSYDDLSRLLSASSTSATTPDYSQSYTYDALGNIIYKSDLGTYGYGTTTYANPHAVTSISTTSNAVPMTIMFDATSTVVDASDSSAPFQMSWNHTATTTGTNRLLVVGVSMPSDIDNILSVTYASSSLTKVREDINAGVGLTSLWYMTNPATGTNSIVVTASSSIRNGEATAITLTNVDQSNPLDAQSGTTTTSTTGATSTITTTTNGDWIVDVVMKSSRTNSLAVGSGQTARQITDGGSVDHGMSTVNGKAVAGSEPMDWSVTGIGSFNWAISAVAFKPALSAGNSTTTLVYDNDGNLASTSIGDTYTWDYKNRLTQSVSTTAISSYKYDYQGNRVSLTEASTTTVFPNKYYSVILGSGSGTTTKNIFLGDLLLSTVDDSFTSGSLASSTTGYKVPGAIVQSTGFTNFSTTTLDASDDIYATSFVPSDPLGRVSTFGFSIPSGATINGIEVTLEANISGGTVSIPFSLSWNNGTNFTSTKSKTFNTSDSVQTYGGPNDTWGHVWTASQLSDANFQVKIDPPITTFMVSYDQIQVKIYYSASTTPVSSSTVRYILPDQLGSTAVVLNASSTVDEIIDYYPYGSQRFDTKTNYGGEKYKYAQTQYDAGAALNYARARYQNPARGAFISQDPIFWGDPRTQDLTNPQDLNSYSYAIDNPINKKDPNGNLSIQELGGVAAERLSIFNLLLLSVPAYALSNFSFSPLYKYYSDEQRSEISNMARLNALKEASAFTWLTYAGSAVAPEITLPVYGIVETLGVAAEHAHMSDSLPTNDSTPLYQAAQNNIQGTNSSLYHLPAPTPYSGNASAVIPVSSPTQAALLDSGTGVGNRLGNFIGTYNGVKVGN